MCAEPLATSVALGMVVATGGRPYFGLDEMDVGECLIPSLYGGLGKQMDRHTMQNYAPSIGLHSVLSRKINVRIAYLIAVRQMNILHATADTCFDGPCIVYTRYA